MCRVEDLLAALSPARAAAFEEFLTAPTTGDVVADLSAFQDEVEATGVGAEALSGGRKLRKLLHI